MKKRELRLEQFSDGYKIIIAMVADIASRMAEGNPGIENPLEASGVILIDEIDLHLHPKWQREILRKLHEVFPNVQFVVTTHSPIILQGASDIAQIVVLDGDTIKTCNADFTNYDVSQILLSELFGVESVQAPLYDQDIKEQEELLKRYGHLTSEEQKRLAALDEKLKVWNQYENYCKMRKIAIQKGNRELLDLVDDSISKLTAEDAEFTGMFKYQRK